MRVYEDNVGQTIGFFKSEIEQVWADIGQKRQSEKDDTSCLCIGIRRYYCLIQGRLFSKWREQMCIRILVMMILSSTALAQHSGHEPAQSQPDQPRQVQEDSILSVRDAIKASQAGFRNLQKAARTGDEASFADLASRFGSSIEDLMRSVDAARDSNAYRKDLDLAQRSLSRQLQQIQQLEGTAAPAAMEMLTHLEDEVVIARDSILAQQELNRSASADNESNHHGSANHGCGSRRLRFLR